MVKGGDWLEAADAMCTKKVSQRRREILEVYHRGKMDGQGLDCLQLTKLLPPGMRVYVV